MTDTTNKSDKPMDVQKYVQDVLATVEQEREREIVSRRFGLFDRKETLEQIGELLSITRERVRQLEKAIIIKLRSRAEQGQLPHLQEITDAFMTNLHDMGEIARVSNLSARLTKDSNRLDQSRVAFLAELCPDLIV